MDDITERKTSTENPARGTRTHPSTLRSPDSPSSIDSDPSTRGTLVIAERAIEKVASNAASNVPGVSGPSSGFLGLGARHSDTARPKVDVQLNGLIASLRLKVGITYPAPLRRTTELLRERVRGEVSRICGLDVRQIDIDIDTLADVTRSQGRRELA
ncbi:Asp23/Gls24 family envelope stress response protein [Arthrobacter pityocampae]|uniref:Asp23/Gls24 family envelope stress response protein n=1 Tax=Arthrobacter pityocampae TaxID=547334 RepID=UPI00373515A0